MEKLFSLFNLENDKRFVSIETTPTGHLYTPFKKIFSIRRSNEVFPLYKIQIDNSSKSVILQDKDQWAKVIR